MSEVVAEVATPGLSTYSAHRRKDLAEPTLNSKLGEAHRLSLFPVVALLIAAAYVGLFLYFSYQSRVLRPYSDMFDLVAFYFQFQESGNWLHYLLEPHNYHRLIWYRLLLALDVAFKGTGLPFVVVAGLCMGAVTVLLTRQVAAMPLKGVRLPGMIFVVMLVLSTSNAVDLSVPANTPYVHTLLFAVLTILLAERPGEGLRTVDGRRIAALACACGAAFSNAVGFVLWPALAFLAWRGGRSERAWLFTVLATGGAFATAYVWDQASHGEAAALSIASLAKSADYFFAYLGLPWSRAHAAGGRLLGAALFGFALVALLRKGGAGSTRAERVALGLILFSLGTAALAALGRRDIAEAVLVPGRYNLLVAPLKIGLVMLALPALSRTWIARPRIIEILILSFFAFYLVKQAGIGQVVAEKQRIVREAITQFHAGARTEQMTLLIHPDLAHAEALCLQMQSHGIYHHAFIPK